MLYFTYFMMVLHAFVGVILIGVILLQRGRGGGLAGAFGGMGGQSAFGTKAGDVFTKITIYLATSWIILGCVCVLLASSNSVKTTIFKGGAKAGIKAAAEEPEKEKDDEKAGKKEDDKAADGKKTEDVDLPGPAPAIPLDGKGDGKTDAKTDGKTDATGDGAKTDVKSEAKDAAPTEKTEPAKKVDPADPKDPAEKTPTEKKPE